LSRLRRDVGRRRLPVFEVFVPIALEALKVPISGV